MTHFMDECKTQFVSFCAHYSTWPGSMLACFLHAFVICPRVIGLRGWHAWVKSQVVATIVTPASQVVAAIVDPANFHHHMTWMGCGGGQNTMHSCTNHCGGGGVHFLFSTTAPFAWEDLLLMPNTVVSSAHEDRVTRNGGIHNPDCKR